MTMQCKLIPDPTNSEQPWRVELTKRQRDKPSHDGKYKVGDVVFYLIAYHFIEDQYGIRRERKHRLSKLYEWDMLKDCAAEFKSIKEYSGEKYKPEYAGKDRAAYAIRQQNIQAVKAQAAAMKEAKNGCA